MIHTDAILLAPELWHIEADLRWSQADTMPRWHQASL